MAMVEQRVYFDMEVEADIRMDLSAEYGDGVVDEIRIGGKTYKIEGELKKFLEDQAFYYADPNGWE